MRLCSTLTSSNESIDAAIEVASRLVPSSTASFHADDRRPALHLGLGWRDPRDHKTVLQPFWNVRFRPTLEQSENEN